ncbi:MAG: 16S rRNA (guanine(966)-N(2))-methyltransferase RsmD [Chloroflexi bacterium]|nr:16S rRNA (guanine(966)-N(2))-methyltransferase RsmD [Chloroflexota bacterium]
MRVITGTAKGRRLAMVPGKGSRPIGDRVKESLFNIIGIFIQDSRFLDLFAGTGSVGIEALSRGAAACIFLDNNSQAIKTIEANIELTGFYDRGFIILRDAFEFLRGEGGDTFDIVYVAPPQYLQLWKKTLLILDNSPQWLNPDAWVIAQMHPDEYEQLELVHLEEFDKRRYGNTLLVFYELPGE